MLGQAYNLQAKVARAQYQRGKKGLLEKSNESYEKAKGYLPQSLQIIGSQIALWTDFAWRENEYNKLLAFLNDVDNFEQQIEHFRNYSLGLANLSWLLIQATEEKNAIALGLNAEKQHWCLLQAECLAKRAVELLELSQSENDAINTAKSNNAYLFLGIVYYKQKEYKKALIALEAGLINDCDHPSLLRRRAMTLEQLQRYEEAYEAYLCASIELRYRLNNPLDSDRGLYESWLREIEDKIPALLAQLPCQNDANAKQQPFKNQVLQYLREERYTEAHQTLQDMLKKEPENKKWIETTHAWLARHFHVENGVIYPKRDQLQSLLGIYAIPRPYEFITLSLLAYEAKHPQHLALPSGWREIRRSDVLLNRQSGYLGVVYQNERTGQIVISHGGTDITELNDILTDLQLANGKQHQQLVDAANFTKEVMATTAQTSPESQLMTIYHTGHSLGGHIASYLACTLQPLGRHYAVTFDNPSCYWQLQHFYGKEPFEEMFQGLTSKERRDFPVTTYLTRPTFINCAGGTHIGRVIRIQVNEKETPKPALKVLQDAALQKIIEKLLEYIEQKTSLSTSLKQQFAITTNVIQANLACHDVHLIQAAFSHQESSLYKQPEKTGYVEKWPKDLEEWLKFEQIIEAEKQNPLTIIPGFANEGTVIGKGEDTLKDVYWLTAAHSEPDVGSFDREESIPMDVLGTEMGNIMKQILPHHQQLTPTQMQLIQYFNQKVLSLYLTPDCKNQRFLLKNALTSWELFTYLRQQMEEACRRQNRTIASGLYPHLAALQPRRTYAEIKRGRFFSSASAEEGFTKKNSAAVPKTVQNDNGERHDDDDSGLSSQTKRKLK